MQDNVAITFRMEIGKCAFVNVYRLFVSISKSGYLGMVRCLDVRVNYVVKVTNYKLRLTLLLEVLIIKIKLVQFLY